MTFFNAHEFLIPTRKSLIDTPQGCAYIFEDVLEPTVSIDYNNRNHATQENDILHEKFHEMFLVCLRINSRDNILN